MSGTKKLPYVYGVTFTSISDIKTVLKYIFVESTYPLGVFNTTNGNVSTYLSDENWQMSMLQHIVLNNNIGGNNIDLTAPNNSIKNLQNALNLKYIGSSAVLTFVKYGEGTASVSVHGIPVMASNTKYGKFIIQATNVSEDNPQISISIILNI